MAYFGLSMPVIAKLDVKTGKYSNGLDLGKLCGTSVTPNKAEGSMYANREMSKHRDKFKNATVEVETDDFPIEAYEILFGHTVSEDKTTVSFCVDDSSNYVGYGFVGISAEGDGSEDTFTACWLHKVMFSEGANSYTAEGENITFTGHKITGIATRGVNTKEWYEMKRFATEEEAYAYIKTKAGITPAA